MASSPNLAIAPCTFAADKGAQLEVEVMAPDAPHRAAALTLSASSGVDPRTLSAGAKAATTTTKGVTTVKGVAKLKADGPKADGPKTAGRGGGVGGGGMMGAKKTVVGMGDLYGSLE